MYNDLKYEFISMFGEYTRLLKRERVLRKEIANKREDLFSKREVAVSKKELSELGRLSNSIMLLSGELVGNIRKQNDLSARAGETLKQSAESFLPQEETK